jgi:predicted phage baseplate assembly protein
VPTTAIAGAGDRVFTTRDEPGGGLSVVFGDGEHGARPPTGSNNLRATYRKGTGAGGNVRPDTLSQPLDRPLGLKGVTNPSPAVGGVDPEAETHARRSIPVPVRTLGRAVSLRDHADFALAFTGIGKADAIMVARPGGPTVVVTVADDDGLPPPATVVTRLAGELRRQGDPLVRALVLPCRTSTFRIALKVKVDPARERDVVFAAVEQALRETFSAPARGIGDHMHRSEVIAVAASVVGVVAVDLDRLYRGGAPTLMSRLVAQPPQLTEPTPLGAEVLALSPEPFDWLLETP